MVGVVLRARGLRGELMARATGPTLGALGPGALLRARRRGQAERRLTLAALSAEPSRLMLQFEELETREDAAALVGWELLAPAAVLPPPPDADTFYVRELIGCQVLAGERPLGVVTEVHAAPANDALEVAGPDGPLLVPFTADAVTDLDLTARRIVIRPDLLGDGAGA
ncbi:MAG: rRNA processing protein RimM [Miltoncostaeaceae bacterium]|nr:rRNA processing protein RimM [Miltoncostaeaceae bacterium]